MKILVLSFYFRPDLSACSFRTAAFVAALKERAPPGTQIDVITTLPNRYRTFSREAPEVETSDALEVRRIGLPPHRSDIIGQSRAFARFARRTLQITSHREYDVVFATSSRLMTATLGSWVARRKRAALYLDIRDIFVDTIAELFSRWISWPAQRLFSLVERWTMRRAARVNLVSRGFEGYFRARYPNIPLSWFTNGVDDEFLRTIPRPKAANGRVATILYAGNIGDGQALHRIVPGVARALHDRVRFVIVGDGGRRADLESAVAGLPNVELVDPMSRAELREAYLLADVLFLHLGDYAAFEKVLPSKIFEYAAVGKPILAGVAGYAARFVQEEISNAAVFSPCDVAGAVEALGSLDIEDRARPEFVAKYARSAIARLMADEVLMLARAGS